jgi:uncharacterized protein (TIGR02118 family)
MVRISVLYPGGPGKKFDLDYYAKKHMTLVRDRIGSMGLVRIEVDKGVAGGAPGAPAPFVAVGHLYFNSVDAFQKAMQAHGKELVDDLPNFTDIQPQFQISEILP